MIRLVVANVIQRIRELVMKTPTCSTNEHMKRVLRGRV